MKPAICVIDDRADQREIVVENLNLNLPGNWQGTGSKPLPTLDLYPSWIQENDIFVLILDEKLNEAFEDGAEAVNYEGHDIVDYLRKRMPDFPIFVVTSHKGDESIQSRFSEVNEILERGDFNLDPKKYIPRVVRSGNAFLAAHQLELSALSEFATKVAKGGQVSEDEKQQAYAIQAKISLSFGLDEINTMSQWFDEMQSAVDELEELKVRLEDRLNKTS